MPGALLPLQNDETGRWETSIYRIDGLAAARIWTLGYTYLENVAENRHIKARASGLVSIVTGQGLQFDVNGRPYPRHADIIGWPNGDKHARMMAAARIANELTLQIDPRGA